MLEGYSVESISLAYKWPSSGFSLQSLSTPPPQGPCDVASASSPLLSPSPTPHSMHMNPWLLLKQPESLNYYQALALAVRSA